MMLRAVRCTRWFQTIRHWRYWLLDSKYRAQNRDAAAAFDKFVRAEGGRGLSVNVLPRGGPQKTALIISQSYLPFARLEALMVKAFQMAGFRTLKVGNRRYDFLRYSWLSGNETNFEATDFEPRANAAWVDQRIGQLNDLHSWLALEHDGVHVGRFAIASTLRFLRVGRLNFSDAKMRDTLRFFLETSVLHAVAAARLMTEIKPDCVLVMDRGYTGHGEAFDVAINRGIDAVMWNLGYKSNRLVVKRYNAANERDHFLCPSTETWTMLRALPWTSEQGRRVRQEIFDCYQSQDWFSFVGTQFDKQILSAQGTREKLGIGHGEKVAVIFPHILWDGSFFSGTDLFEDYTQWLVETLRAAAANPRLRWVVKLHPAHVVKAKQGNDQNLPSELSVIRSTFGTLPAHIKLVHPEEQISTYSLFEIADYTVTVRGTVGIESALLGIPTITAGTGRYDRRGFTIDSTTREEYLQRLATLDTYSRLSPEQIELAERFAYATFFGRPLTLVSASLEYARDGKATPAMKVRCQTREDWLAAPDMHRLSRWLADGKTEDMLTLPDLPAA
jgi:hypothetical protein